MRRPLIMLACAALLPACGGGGTGQESSGDCVDLTEQGTTFTIRLADVRFDPSCFTASASQGIRLVNEDDVAHTFTMLNTGIDVRVEAGATVDGAPVTGIVDPGTYQLICRLHELMQGRVTVVA